MYVQLHASTQQFVGSELYTFEYIMYTADSVVPDEPFQNFEALKSVARRSFTRKKPRWSTDFQALKLGKGSSGCAWEF